MLLKGIVQQNPNNQFGVYTTSDTKIYVIFPDFMSPGSSDAQVVECRICYSSGSINLYSAGDIVWVAFEKNQLNIPIIIGKLYYINEYGNSEELNNTFFQAQAIDIKNKAVLPKDTKIGDLSYEDLTKLIKDIQALENSKQDNLISGQSIKTINGQSLLGTGDITIEGGSGIEVVTHTVAEWNAMPGYVGQSGTICVYTDYTTYTDESNSKTYIVPAVKVANGKIPIIDLGFIGGHVEHDLYKHINDMTRHITQLERETWNNKVQVDYEPNQNEREELYLNITEVGE